MATSSKRSQRSPSPIPRLPRRSRNLITIFAGILTLLLLFSWINPTGSQGAAIYNAKQKTILQDEIAGDYLLGVGRADITGPVVEVNMMGYADTAQSGTGLRQRLYCRAFIVGSSVGTDKRLAYLVLDTQSGDAAVRHGIIEGLKDLGSEYEVYTRHNGSALAVTGTHSHSGPGAWLNYLLPQITSKGFDKNSYQAITDGCVLAMKRAHQNVRPGQLSLGQGSVTDANINRSPYAYLQNPQHERDKYTADVDKEVTVLSFQDTDGKPMGVLTWFPVHGTSLYQNNTLITGDNKGVAAYLLEKEMESTNPDYVAGFSQSNVGDTSPNVLGAYCEATGLECKFEDSTCNNRTQGCHGRGPFYQHQDQGTKSCYEIGKRQYQAVLDVINGSNMQRLQPGTIASFHTYTDFSSYEFISPFDSSRTLRTCAAALGYGFAGGTTDGPGAFDFQQGTNDTDDDSPSLRNPVWRIARAFIHRPTDEQIKCQSPKPVLLDVGEAKKPYAWSPNIVDIQVQRIGSLLIIVAPGEATTMSGRRWRKAVARTAADVLSIENPHVVLGGPANTYAHYIATEEEYSVQRYEGASTLYGPHTLAAHINLTTTFLPYLGSKDEVAALMPLPLGPQPPINTNRSYNFINGVVFDGAGLFKKFGDEIDPPAHTNPYKPGETVTARFIGANPRNNFRLEGTFAAVEMFSIIDTKGEPNGGPSGVWIEVRNDRDWHLVYRWKRTSTVLGTSEVTIEWEVEEGTKEGVYRIRYFGDSKTVGGTITPFEGIGKTFRIGSSTGSTGTGTTGGLRYGHSGDLFA